MSTTRFPNGVTNVFKGTTLGRMGQLDPTEYLTVFDDLVLSTDGWGADLTAIDGAGGLATLATTTVAETPTACFQLNQYKELYCKVKLSMDTVTGSTVTLGFSDSIAAPTVGVYFEIADGNTLTFNIDGTSTTSGDLNISIADGEEFTLGFAYNARQGFELFVNDVKVGRVVDISNLDTSTLMTFGVLSNGPTTTLDYLLAVQER